jgi:hypothetical protein
VVLVDHHAVGVDPLATITSRSADDGARIRSTPSSARPEALGAFATPRGAPGAGAGADVGHERTRAEPGVHEEQAAHHHHRSCMVTTVRAPEAASRRVHHADAERLQRVHVHHVGSELVQPVGGGRGGERIVPVAVDVLIDPCGGADPPDGELTLVGGRVDVRVSPSSRPWRIAPENTSTWWPRRAASRARRSTSSVAPLVKSGGR